MSDSAIDIRNLRFAYHDGRVALDRITLSIGKGEKAAVVGANGAGKSTLLLHLNGLLSGSGSVSVMGTPIARRSLNSVRRQVGLLFQDPDDQLFSPTVFDDVSFGPLAHGLPEAEARQRTAEALEQVGLSGYERRSPHHLSYGEKKRVALATVLAMWPRILALDEPTANLDPRSRRHLLDILKQYDGTLVIATHDLEAALALCSRAIVLDKGTIACDGRVSDLLSDAGLMERTGLEVPLSLKLAR
ncbi:MAG: ABC transporter ATP-binding protein [Candidatus Edwardsbacteria bacterium]|nr:ABC transporter ATP-binding protein [Candidatus Edwardsbacteria bacterium]